MGGRRAGAGLSMGGRRTAGPSTGGRRLTGALFGCTLLIYTQRLARIRCTEQTLQRTIFTDFTQVHHNNCGGEAAFME